MAVKGGFGVDFRAEINVSEFLGTLKKLVSDKVTERKVLRTIILCCHTPSRVERMISCNNVEKLARHSKLILQRKACMILMYTSSI